MKASEIGQEQFTAAMLHPAELRLVKPTMEEKYIKLADKYNDLADKYIELQDKYIELVRKGLDGKETHI
jgi:hypothetical protein